MLNILDNIPEPKASFAKNLIPHPAIRQTTNVLKGKSIFEVVKSSKSKNVLSASLKLANGPKDKVAGILTAAIIKLTIIVAFLRERLKFSINEEIEVSIILIPDVIAAKNNRIKNTTPNSKEQGSLANISGSEIKIKVAPAVGSTPNENTTGKIIIPASIAISVSKKIKVYADLIILVFLSI